MRTSGITRPVCLTIAAQHLGGRLTEVRYATRWRPVDKMSRMPDLISMAMEA